LNRHQGSGYATGVALAGKRSNGEASLTNWIVPVAPTAGANGPKNLKPDA
jgi:hypothetical protein